MSQREKLLALFNEMGIPFETETPITGKVVRLEVVDNELDDDLNIVGKERVVTGYAGFICDFHFNEDGSFSKVDITE
jgi:hypothetical protein